MNRTKFKNSQILLIIIGVLVAIVIGLNSKAGRMPGLEKKWSRTINIDSSQQIKKILHESIDQTKEMISVFLSFKASRG